MWFAQSLSFSQDGIDAYMKEKMNKGPSFSDGNQVEDGEYDELDWGQDLRDQSAGDLAHFKEWLETLTDSPGGSKLPAAPQPIPESHESGGPSAAAAGPQPSEPAPPPSMPLSLPSASPKGFKDNMPCHSVHQVHAQLHACMFLVLLIWL